MIFIMKFSRKKKYVCIYYVYVYLYIYVYISLFRIVVCLIVILKKPFAFSLNVIDY